MDEDTEIEMKMKMQMGIDMEIIFVSLSNMNKRKYISRNNSVLVYTDFTYVKQRSYKYPQYWSFSTSIMYIPFNQAPISNLGSELNFSQFFKCKSFMPAALCI